MAEIAALRRRLTDRLKAAREDEELKDFRVVTMNDFSLDRIVSIESFDAFVREARKVLARGGGLLPRSVQNVQQGGCAANAATTLARLGIDTHFICRTDSLGKHMLKYYLEANGVNIDNVKTDGRLALVACFEVGAEKCNIMVNDQESFGSFGYSDLDDGDLALLESADLVGIFDWSLNRKGTDLAEKVCSRLRRKEIPVFLDTSDPTPRTEEIGELFEKVFKNDGLTYLNLNENELCQFSGVPNAAYAVQRYLELTHSLQRRIKPLLNVHTTKFSIDISRDDAIVPTFRIVPKRATGAGDAWNGGNIAGFLLGLDPGERLMLANAVAAIYGESNEATRPTLQDVVAFLEDPARGFNEPLPPGTWD